MNEFVSIALLAFIESLTEFLPVSSTAHLLFVIKLMGLENNQNLQASVIIMQLGAILSVCFIFRTRLFPSNLNKDQITKFIQIYLKLLIAFIPTAICGILFYKKIKTIFFSSSFPSATLLIIGGLFLIKDYSKIKHKHDYLIEEIPLKIIFFIGLFQTISIFPGVSRSGATIIGSLILGLSIKTAIEVSFFLALPTILSASLYEIIFGKIYVDNNTTKVIDVLLHSNGLIIIGFGFVLAFVFSMIIVPRILSFTQKHGFRLFGYYRILIGVLILSWFICQRLI